VPAGRGFRSGAIVCDGVGGAAAGEVASRTAIEHVTASLAAGDGPLPDRLRAAIADANAAVRAYARDELEGAASGSTIVMALVGDGQVTIAHVGDSRAYLLRGGALSQLTADHSFVAEQVRAGVLKSDEAETHPLRGRLTKAIGVADEIEPDVRQESMRAGDVLLLCSDGLHAMASDAEIAAAIGPDVTRSAKALVDLANKRGGKDNVSVALYRVV
jgi:protein phosphatase